MSKYGATMTQAPDFAYRLCAERFALERFASSSPRLGELNLSKLRRCLNASERIDADTAMIFSRAFGGFGFDVRAMSAGTPGRERRVRVRRRVLARDGQREAFGV